MPPTVVPPVPIVVAVVPSVDAVVDVVTAGVQAATAKSIMAQRMRESAFFIVVFPFL